MNQFFFWINKQGIRVVQISVVSGLRPHKYRGLLFAGDKELVTAPLDGTILPGVTRDSILTLARQWNEFKVSERRYSIYEVIEAVNENRVSKTGGDTHYPLSCSVLFSSMHVVFALQIIESFGSGTAAIVSPVKGFRFQEKV